jgi:hypothetical protein
VGKVGLVGLLGFGREKPVSLHEFRGRVCAEILKLRPDCQFELVGDAELMFGDGGKLNVENGYNYYMEERSGLKSAVRQLVQFALYEPAAVRAEELIVLVRPAQFQVGDDGDADRGLARALPGGLVAVVAADQPENYAFARASEFRAELGMDDEQIWDRAFANLRARMDMTPPAFRPDTLLGITTDVGLAASYLVDDGFWAHRNLGDLGDLVVAPFEKDRLIVAPASEPAAVRALRNIVAGERGADFLCDRLLLRRNGHWEDFE